MLITLSAGPLRRRPNKTGSRTAPKRFISDSQWKLIRHLFPKRQSGPRGGRPGVDPRACLEGVLWVLKTGARWKDLPERYPSPATCWRRHKEWSEECVYIEMWEILLAHMNRQKRLNWEAAFGDGTFSPAKKGGSKSARPNGAREQKFW